jgi:hypothetical protein
MRRLRSFRPLVELLEARCLLTAIADPANLFAPAQSVNASSTNPNAAFAAINVVDRSNAAFRFADLSGPQRLAISNFNAAINTLRFFDTPSYSGSTASSVTIYYSPARQLALTPASYTELGVFALPTTSGVYQTPTSPADHPRATDPGGNPALTIDYDQLTGLTIPAGTQSILLDFGSNPTGLGFGFSEIQALGAASTARQADPTLLGWGLNVYQKINASLQVLGSNLYAETASLSGTQSGGDSGFAYVWPEAVMFRTLDDLVAIQPATYTPVMRAFSDELFTRYWTTSSPGGYRSGVSSGATLFYDDNGHTTVALAEAYNLTGDPVYLSRAIQDYQFVLSGEDSAGGGGIYFSVPDHTEKNAISTLQAVRAALLLYQLTGQAQYLTDATRLYTWCATHIQQSNGLFYQEYALSSMTPQGTPLINGAGIGLLDNFQFFQATGNAAYLREAQLIGTTSLTRYFNSLGAINDEGYWDFELVDGLNALYLTDQNPAWHNATTGALTWLKANREDPNGHYGTLWARDTYTPGTVRTSWNMIDQAAVAESYLNTAAVNLPTPPLVTSAADTIAGFAQGSVGGNDVPSSAGSGAGQYPAAEGPANAVDDNAGTEYLNYGNGNSGTSSTTKGVGTGFYVTPALGPSIVTGIQVATAVDNASGDPLTVSVEGTNATANFDAGATWKLIASNVDLGIGTDPGRKTYGPIVHFLNSTAYLSYRVIIASQRGSDTSVRYAELNLIGARALVAIITPGLPPWTAGASYSQTFQTTGGTGAITFKATGTLPSGLTLSSSGVLSGFPKTAGTFTFTITATDTAGFAASQTYTQVINPLHYVVTVVGSSTIAAGRAFLVAVQAVDPGGNPITNYGGPSTVTASINPGSPGSGFPATLAINKAGFGLLLATLKQVGTYSLSVANGSFTGTASPFNIVPGPPVKLAFVTQPVSTPTGVALPPVSVQVLDLYGNLVAGDNSDQVTLGIAAAPGPGAPGFTAGSTTTVPVHNGVATFSNLTLAQPGSYTLSAQVLTLYTGPNSVAFNVLPLQVVSLAGSPSGFALQFNAPLLINTAMPVLYGAGFGNTAPVPSVTLTQIKDVAGNPVVPVPVEGSLIINPASNSLTFLATNTTGEVNNGTPILRDGTYQVVVHSSGITGLQGELPGAGYLDGLNTGMPGSGDYLGTFTVSAATEDVLWLPDTADGPLQPLEAPGANQSGGGYPLYLDIHHTGAAITDVQVALTYNPALLTVTSTSTSINGGTFTVTASAGTAVLHWTGPGLAATAGAPFPVGFISATVPNSSMANPIYKAENLLHLSSPSINSGSEAVTTSDGLHLVAYVGDADGNGAYGSSDAILITRVALQSDSGFTAYPLVDPVIVADIDGSGFIPADAALQVNEAGVGAATANLPSPPIPPGAGVAFVTTLSPAAARSALNVANQETPTPLVRQPSRTDIPVHRHAWTNRSFHRGLEGEPEA